MANFLILPRQGEVAAKLTEGDGGDAHPMMLRRPPPPPCCAWSPSPWRGRI